MKKVLISRILVYLCIIWVMMRFILRTTHKFSIAVYGIIIVIALFRMIKDLRR